ncbi:hypothetical protein A5881_003177 [Enterococcus termitis]|jgi:hypothetical protein|uniref:Uncharacterized protein n=1 Tax=Enterococcus termitis TaxID=332950 RepID=A0A1E5GK48_9ENTE|nr:hypothetical protein BCR25_06280 [Enterococcus termitis]
MNVYIWLYILGACGIVSLGLFLYSLNRDNILVKKLKLKKKKILVNWLLLVISIVCFSMMIYLFIYIQNQLNLFELN